MTPEDEAILARFRKLHSSCTDRRTCDALVILRIIDEQSERAAAMAIENAKMAGQLETLAAANAELAAANVKLRPYGLDA